jgi:hypothetical protein
MFCPFAHSDDNIIEVTIVSPCMVMTGYVRIYPVMHGQMSSSITRLRMLCSKTESVMRLVLGHMNWSLRMEACCNAKASMHASSRDGYNGAS